MRILQSAFPAFDITAKVGVNASGHESNGYVLIDEQDTGKLYDDDDASSADGILVATFAGAPELRAADFYLI